ncbi:MAG: HlyD family efflux transporter periplasmic adaptor subunit [Longimicrobiales bacterium]|nr:HlyD family efflux transporter periplasmic adaptor subunit [Longimicrobiales bacterium]
MDIIRDTKPKKKKRTTWAVVGVAGFVLIALGVASLPTAVPSVDRAVIWSDTVEFGTLVRQIRGPGTLVPEQARLITAVTNGRVEEIRLLPGAEVTRGDVILRMTNPDVDVQLLQSQTQLAQAQSSLLQLQSNLRTQELQQRQALVQLRGQEAQARRDYETNQRLWDISPDLVSRYDLERTREEWESLVSQVELEEERLEVTIDTQGGQLASQELQVERLEAQVEFNRDRLASLVVEAPQSGLLAPLASPLQEGQWVNSGQEIARIVVPDRLKAEIRITQTQVQEIAVGQRALIDTRSDTIDGRVTRIDPAVRQGTVTIDVSLEGPLPPSARADLSVDGNVIIEQLDDVIYVTRPNFGQANQRVSLFRVTEDGNFAERVIVELGASSVNEIEIVSGLQPGDVVILSDMSQWDGFDRVRLKE